MAVGNGWMVGNCGEGESIVRHCGTSRQVHMPGSCPHGSRAEWTENESLRVQQAQCIFHMAKGACRCKATGLREPCHEPHLLTRLGKLRGPEGFNCGSRSHSRSLAELGKELSAVS